MNNRFLAFCFGIVTGSVATWYFVKKKYEQIAQEEIDSVKKVFAAKMVALSTAQEDHVHPPISDEQLSAIRSKKPDLNTYTKTIAGSGYGSDLVSSTSNNKGSGVYVIAPNEFGDFPDYNQVSLKYFSDGIIVDEDGEVLDDANITEEDFVDHFGEYEDDSVYIRDDMRCCDYEILKDGRTYEEYMDGK